MNDIPAEEVWRREAKHQREQVARLGSLVFRLVALLKQFLEDEEVECPGPAFRLPCAVDPCNQCRAKALIREAEGDR